MKLIKTLTWTGAFTAGLFLGAITHDATAHASPALQSSSQQPTPDPNVTDRDRAGQDRNRSQAEPVTITGELTRVDPQSKTFSVKSASGAEMLFRYDDKTIVTGAETNVAGLATSSGSEVTVSYRNDSAGNMASKIEVHPKR